MNIQTKIPILQKYYLGDDVIAFSTTRHEGISIGKYSSFNINEYCGDKIENVKQNRIELAKLLNIKSEDIIIPHQIHKTNIEIIESNYFEISEKEQKEIVYGKDALITNIKNICIGVSTADCIPILVYDKQKHISCAIHAGWRGTAKRITEKTINKLIKQFYSNPKFIKVVIGPGISVRNFEVGDEVYEYFYKEGFDMKYIAKKYNKWHIDLPLCNKLQLINSGINPENITCTDICTCQNASTFFSARKLGTLSGSIYNGIILK